MRLKLIAAFALLSAACSEETSFVPQEELDAGVIDCAEGQVARYGSCYCQTDVACPADQYCEAVTGTCKPRPVEPEPDAGVEGCTSGALRCAPAPLKAIQRCEEREWVDLETCPEEGFCAAAATGYFCAVCSPGVARCKGGDAIEICSEKGDLWAEEPCPINPDTGAPAACVEDQCQVCTPGTTRCSDDGRSLETCQPDGLAWLRQLCPITNRCEAADGLSACAEPFCMPGDRRCKVGSTTNIEVCKDDGSAFEEKDCRTFDQYATQSATCQNNACYDPCGQAARESSYQGCEYFAAVTTNSQLDASFKGDAEDGTQPSEVSEFAVVVSNPDTINAAKVKVTRKVGSAEQVSPSEPSPDANGFITVQPGRLQIIKLPWQAVSETGLGAYAYRIVSERPISAYQFNPVVAYTGGAPVEDPLYGCTNCSYTNDASLLIPAHILGTSYVVLGQEHITIAQSGTTYAIPSFFSVVALKDRTKVTIKFSAATKAARSGVPIAAQQKGSVKDYTLNRFDVLQFWTNADGAPVQCAPGDVSGSNVCRYASDPTGTVILSENMSNASEPAPVAVFSGADCTFKPFNKWACDHVEEMMVPFSTWGKTYAGVKSVPYKTAAGSPVGNPSPDYWRVVAGCGQSSCPNGSHITVSPPPAGVVQAGICDASGNCTLPPMDATQKTAPWFEFTHRGDFTVTSDQPIMLSQFFTGQSANAGADEGDPSLILTPPVEQWRRDYNVLTSPTYAHNYLSLVTQAASATITINGRNVNSFAGVQTATIGGTYKVYRVPIPAAQAGPQQISSTAKVGVTVYGYDVYVSYGYTGGLDLTKITQINPGG